MSRLQFIPEVLMAGNGSYRNNKKDATVY